MSARDEEIQTARVALAALPRDSPERPRMLAQQSLRLDKRAAETGDTKDLDEAMQLSKEAVQRTSSDLPVRQSVLRLAYMQAEKRFSRTHSAEDLNDIIDWVLEFLSIIPQHHVYRGKWTLALAARLFQRFAINHSETDLEEAIRFVREAIDLHTSEGHFELAQALAELGRCLGARYATSGNLDDLEESVVSFRKAADMTPEDNASRRWRVEMLTMALQQRRSITGEGLDDSITFGRELYQKSPRSESHSDWMRQADSLSSLLLRRHAVRGADADLDEAVEIFREVARDASLSDERRAERLYKLAHAIAHRYLTNESLSDLNDAISTVQQATELLPRQSLEKVEWLVKLGEFLELKYAVTGEAADLDEAIHHCKEIGGSAFPPRQDGISSNQIDGMKLLASLLMKRWKKTISLEDLLETHRLPTRASDILALTAEESVLSLIANEAQLATDPQRDSEALKDVNQAIDTLREAIHSMEPDDERRGKILVDLVTALSLRRSTNMASEQSTADLEEAISLCKEFLQSASPDPSERIEVLSKYSRLLVLSFKRKNVLNDLNEAIQVTRKLIHLAKETQNDTERLLQLYALSKNLLSRYQRTLAKEDMDEVVTLRREVLDLLPPNHEGQSSAISSLALALRLRFAALHSDKDLDEAIQLQNGAMELVPADHEDRPFVLSELGEVILLKYLRSRNPNDLETSLRLCREALDLDSRASSGRAFRLFCLARCHMERLMASFNVEDLEETVKLGRQALEARPEAYYGKGSFLGQLGVSLLFRPAGQGISKYHDEGLTYIKQSLGYKETPAFIRLIHCHSALHSCMINQKWEDGFVIADLAMLIIPELIVRSPQNRDRQRSLQTISWTASYAAAFALQTGRDPTVALNFLEAGRGLLFASLEELRTDIHDLQGTYSDLADDFIHLRSQLDGEDALIETISIEVFEDAAFGESFQTRTDQRHQAEQALNELLVKIRSKPGFEDFLRVTPSEQAMRHAAEGGPLVVINVNKIRCDAIIVQKSQIQHVPLPELSLSDIETRTDSGNLLSADTLEWLWNCVANPVLKVLGFIQAPPPGERWPRLWWIPTGILSTLPIHAAGCAFEHSSDSVLDRVVSSYSGSIKAIIHGRRRRSPPNTETLEGKALLVAMETTPNASSLPFAAAEVSIVRKACQSLKLIPIEPERTLEQVVKVLRQCRVFHFAGHGSTHASDPSMSQLILKDGRGKSLTVAALMDANMRQQSPPFLAYLSACGTGRTREKKLFDESVHLISGFQLAGFRHVIGTLWEVNDETCVDMAKLFYEGLRVGGMTDESVCLAVHHATRELRDRWYNEMTSRGENVDSRREKPKTAPVEGLDVGPDEEPSRDITSLEEEEEEERRRAPLLWAPYVHFGV